MPEYRDLWQHVKFHVSTNKFRTLAVTVMEMEYGLRLLLKCFHMTELCLTLESFGSDVEALAKMVMF